MYNQLSRALKFLVAVILPVFIFSGVLKAQNPVKIPIGSNTYYTAGKAGTPDRMGRSGIQNWQSEETVYSIWFHVDRPAELLLAIQLEVPEGKSEIKVAAGGQTFRLRAKAGGEKIYKVGRISAVSAGYIKVDLQGSKRTGSEYARPSALLVSSKDNQAKFSDRKSVV